MKLEAIFCYEERSTNKKADKACFTQNGVRKFAMTFVTLQKRLPDPISSIRNMFFESLDPIERVLPFLKMLIFGHFVLRKKVG